MDDPWEFNKNGRFTTLKDDHNGKWNVEIKRKSPEHLYISVTMNWKTTRGSAEFVFVDLTQTSQKLLCFKSGWEFM